MPKNTCPFLHLRLSEPDPYHTFGFAHVLYATYGKAHDNTSHTVTPNRPRGGACASHSPGHVSSEDTGNRDPAKSGLRRPHAGMVAIRARICTHGRKACGAHSVHVQPWPQVTLVPVASPWAKNTGDQPSKSQDHCAPQLNDTAREPHRAATMEPLETQGRAQPYALQRSSALCTRRQTMRETELVARLGCLLQRRSCLCAAALSRGIPGHATPSL